MSDTKKLARRMRAKKRLIITLDSGVKVNKDGSKAPLNEGDVKRISNEIQRLDHYIQGGKKEKKNQQGEVIEKEKDVYFIDIYSISTSYVKRSERKKNKGKSTKKLKQQKTVSFVRSVKSQPGMITAYKDGKMGLSPRTHKFQMRKEEPVRM